MKKEKLKKIWYWKLKIKKIEKKWSSQQTLGKKLINYRIGRMIMARSDPMDKKVVEVKVVIDEDAEDEKRYFTEDKWNW